MSLREILGDDLPLDELTTVSPFDEICAALGHPTDSEDVKMADGTMVGACWCGKYARPIRSQRDA